MIGLNVRYCFVDMAHGKVDPSAVEKVFSSTSARTLEDWDKIIEHYRGACWGKNADEAERLLRQFLAEGKVYQPRLAHKATPSWVDTGSNWVVSESEISWRA